MQLCGSMANEEVLKHWTNQAFTFDATEDLEEEQADVEVHPFKFVSTFLTVLKTLKGGEATLIKELRDRSLITDSMLHSSIEPVDAFVAENGQRCVA